ncbi:MAG: NAD(P)H-binding protein [Henriciella sp.]|nr:NAD(P)H-binding protein [Henriciella sp.]
MTALCRATDDDGALTRMREVLDETEITDPPRPPSDGPGKLKASNRNILEANTYADLLAADETIDGLCCFVGTTSSRQAMSPFTRLYTDTIRAILDGMAESRPVEVLYHSSVGAGGEPANAYVYWPDNYPSMSWAIAWIAPVFRNVARSERLFEEQNQPHTDYITFRPGSLKDHSAEGNYHVLVDLSKKCPFKAELSEMKTSIGREDVANEMLRVATLPEQDRKALYGSSLYLADRK